MEVAPYDVAAAWTLVRVPAVVAPEVFAVASPCPEIWVSAALLIALPSFACYGITHGYVGFAIAAGMRLPLV